MMIIFAVAISDLMILITTYVFIRGGSVVDLELPIPVKWFSIFIERFSIDSKNERSHLQ